MPKPSYDIEVGPETLHGKEGELAEPELNKILMGLILLIGGGILFLIFLATAYFILNPI